MSKKAKKQRVKYSESLISFVDVLGFRDLVAKRKAKDIYDILEEVSALAESDEGIGLRTMAFSDSIVRVVGVDQPSGLFYELMRLLHAQARLSAKGVLLRGGVVFGAVYADVNRVFGPGLVGGVRP